MYLQHKGWARRSVELEREYENKEKGGGNAVW